MRTARFFVPEDWIALSAEAFSIPAGATYKQIVSVLRMNVGDPISLMTNDGAEIDGRITEITRSAIMGVIVGSIVSAPLKPEVVVCCAVLKNDHFELVLQKCTELGATAFIPVLTERTIKRAKDLPARWHVIIKEASEQSGRTTLPVIHDPMKFTDAITKTDGMRRVLFHEAGGAALPHVGNDDKIALFIGPEGGFTDGELTAARDASTHIVNLPGTVLRAETAAIVGTALLRYHT